MPISAAGGALNAAGKLDQAGGTKQSPAAASVLGSLLGIGGALGGGSEGDQTGGDEKAARTNGAKAEQSEQAESENDA